MVDFNNEATITTAPHDVIKIMYLERRKYVIDAIEKINEVKTKGIKPPIHILRSRLIALFHELEPALNRSTPAETMDLLYSNVHSQDENELLEGFYVLNKWFDDKSLTKIDTKAQIDTRRVINVNRQNGLKGLKVPPHLKELYEKYEK